MNDQTAYTAPPPSEVPNYVVQAILVTIFCCMPFGIPALIFAAQADGMMKAGDYAQATEVAAKAKTWCWVSFGAGLLYILIVGGIYGAMFATAMASAGGM